MLSLPRELAVLMQTRLTLVVAHAAGHDPLKATGLVLTYLPWIAAHTRSDEAQFWVLRAANKPAEDPWKHLQKVASRKGTTAAALYDAEKLTTVQALAQSIAGLRVRTFLRARAAVLGAKPGVLPIGMVATADRYERPRPAREHRHALFGQRPPFRGLRQRRVGGREKIRDVPPAGLDRSWTELAEERVGRPGSKRADVESS